MLDRLTVRLRDFAGVRARRLTDSGGARVAEHAHDWPVVSLFVAGSYENQSEIGRTVSERPSAMFYRPGERHANVIGKLGLEQIDLEFDPSWLGLKFKSSWSPVVHWNGGSVGLSARKLARLWSGPHTSEPDLAAATRKFLIQAFDQPRVREPSWLPTALRLIEERTAVSSLEIARALNLQPAWFAEAYRSAMGEGIGDTIRRRRVESAVHMLTSSSEPQAQVAVAAGFCDQSHMIRAFRAVLGRTPGEVRSERQATSSAVSPS